MGVDDEIYCIRAEDGPLEGAVYLIDERLEIGRASSSDVQLVTVGVSRTHAVVMRSADAYVLLDMLSTNGTWVDGAKVQRQVLTPGLRFKIGDCQFVFEAFTGPPRVVTQTRSNSWSEPMIERNTETRIVGPSRGRVM